jgi:hypothetical protein
METKKLLEYKKRYAISKHHAWAGSILLAILLAIRIFLEASEINVDDRIILFVGAILVVYMLIALIFTYRYRTGLSADIKSERIQLAKDEVEDIKIESKIEKNRIKIEKKKAKAELKKEKKSKK